MARLVWSGLPIAAAALALTISSAFAQEALVGEGKDPDLRVEVRDLKRGDGGVVTLRLRLVNDSDAAVDLSCAMREGGFNDSCGEFTGAYLLDATNKKKYTVVRDSEKKCVCSSIDEVAAGKKMNLWATFPAPPDGVENVTVVVPEFEPIEKVPIN
jgi:hypothetical protein